MAGMWATSSMVGSCWPSKREEEGTATPGTTWYFSTCRREGGVVSSGEQRIQTHTPAGKQPLTHLLQQSGLGEQLLSGQLEGGERLLERGVGGGKHGGHQGRGGEGVGQAGSLQAVRGL